MIPRPWGWHREVGRTPRKAPSLSEGNFPGPKFLRACKSSGEGALLQTGGPGCSPSSGHLLLQEALHRTQPRPPPVVLRVSPCPCPGCQHLPKGSMSRGVQMWGFFHCTEFIQDGRGCCPPSADLSSVGLSLPPVAQGLKGQRLLALGASASSNQLRLLLLLNPRGARTAQSSPRTWEAHPQPGPACH